LTHSIRTANSNDIGTILQFIGQAGANVEGIDELLSSVYMYENEQKELKALICVEKIKEDALLRSLVVDKSCQLEDLMAFFKVIITRTKKEKYESLYLLAKSASSSQFLTMFGFEQLSSGNVPSHVQETEHFQKSTKSDTIVMKRKL
jgi:N-acetylglutamate synthase-like GNAT family acetyltransferase